MNKLIDVLPPSVRQTVYVIYAVLGVLLTATQAGFAAVPDVGQPVALTVAFAVYSALGAGFGLLAAANTPSARDVVVATTEPTDKHVRLEI